MLVSESYAPKRLEVHGHRGCRGLWPENSLPAFLHAVQLGVDVIELDVVISADQQIVVSHEPWLNAAICLDPSGQSISPSEAQLYNLYHMPYATIRQCECGLLQHPGFPEQVPVSAYKPLLSEVFGVVEMATKRLGRPPIRYSIEIKSSPEGDNVFHPIPSTFLALVLAELTAARVWSRVTLLCFDGRILQLAHRHRPEIATCLLVEDTLPWCQSIKQLGFVPTTFGPDLTTVTAAAVRALRADYPLLRLVPWTVNEPSDFRRLQALGVDGLTTDYPNRFL